MHSHSPFLFVSLGTTRVSLTPKGANPIVFDTYPGQAIWMDEAAHSWEILSGDMHVIGVEPKSALRAKQGGKAN